MKLLRTLLMIGGGVALYRMISRNRRQMGRMAAMFEPDEAFLMNASEANLLEIRMGHLALEKSQDADVRQYGQRLIDDHTQNQERLRRLAHQHDCTLRNVLTDRHLQHIDQLASRSGTDFDRTFLESMINDHQANIGQYETMAGQARHEDIRAYANENLPVLRDHLRMASALQQRIRQAA